MTRRAVRYAGLLFTFVLVMVALAPHWFSPGGRGLALPRVFSGDEPHHLANLTSVLNDFDLDLRNNYAQSSRGGLDLGIAFTGQHLDHHTVWFRGGERRLWRDVYGIDSARWTFDGKHALSVPLPGQEPWALPPEQAEYSQHPPGNALLLAPLLLPVRHSRLLEPMALIVCAIIVVLCLLACGRLLRSFGIDEATIRWTQLLLLIGSPAWHYGRTLFGEPLLMTGCAIGFAAALAGKRWKTAGFAFGLCVLIKPVILLVPLPMWLLLVAQRNWRALLGFSIPLAFGTLAYLALNWHMFGDPFRAAQHGVAEAHPLEELYRWRHGLLSYCPLVVPAAFGWVRLYRARPSPSFAILAGVVLYAAYFIFFQTSAGACYGPRYVLPVLPLLLLGLAALRFDSMGSTSRVLYSLVIAFSIVTNTMGAIHSWAYWGVHPLQALWWAL